MNTRIREQDLNRELLTLLDQVRQARGGYATLDSRLNTIQGGGGGSIVVPGSVLHNAINIAKTNFKINADIAASKENLEGLIIDVFEDEMGIDPVRSQNYEYDAERKEFRAITDSNWKEVSLSNPPPSRRVFSMTYDSARGKVVLFGGFNGNDLNDTWEYDGANWVQINTPTKPSARWGHALTYDSARGKVVLFGGSSGADETWEYDGSNWVQINTAARPPGRYHHRIVYDSGRGKVVLFGGRDAGDVALNDTWEYDGTNWVQIDTPVKPSARYYHAMAYDSARGKIVLFGGHNLNDTWEYDGTNWVQINTPTKPPFRYLHGLTYDSSRGKVIMFGGFYREDFNDTWEYDGSNWVQIATPTNPSERWGHSLAYDSDRRRVVLFGGDSGGYRNDTWEYIVPTGPAILVSTPDSLDEVPSQVYLVPHLPPEINPSYITFEMSLDDGQTYFPVQPETLVPVPAEATPFANPTLRARAIIPPGVALSGWAYGWI